MLSSSTTNSNLIIYYVSGTMLCSEEDIKLNGTVAALTRNRNLFFSLSLLDFAETN